MVNEEFLLQVSQRVLAEEQVAAAELSIALVDNPRIHQLNREYLNHDYATDVLSFLLDCEPAEEVGSPQEQPPTLRGQGKRLDGEVIVSTETAMEAAEKFGWSPEEELVLYLIHGILHLLGYDDLCRTEQTVMRSRERAMLTLFNITPPQTSNTIEGEESASPSSQIASDSDDDPHRSVLFKLRFQSFTKESGLVIPTILPILTGLLLLATWMFSLAGYALRDFSRNRMDEICKKRELTERFGEILNHHLQTLLVVDMGFCVMFSGLVGLIAIQSDSWAIATETPAGWAAFVGQLLGLAVLLLLWAVILPRTWARLGGERFLVRAWPLLGLIRKMASPAVKIAEKFDQLAHRMAGLPEPETGTAPSLVQDILSVVDESHQAGELEPQTRTMIHRVMELQQEDVAAIMTPRTEMHVLQVDTPLEEARNVLLEGGHSRVPVVGESTDDIIGILYAKDLLQHINNTNGHVVTLKDIAREAIYVPESTGLDKLLERMKREHVHIAIVIDEYSGVSGLVTLEDILEEIVGEITDEYDPEEVEEIHRISEDVIEVDARVHVDELNEQFHFDLPEDGDFETMGGFVFNQLGRVPKKSESFTWKNLRVTILNVGKRKIHKLRVEVDRSFLPTAAEM